MMRLTTSLFAILLFCSAAADSSLAAAPSAPSEDQRSDATTAQTIDKLYDRLAKTKFPEEADGILEAIDRARMESGSDTADLLMSRALEARSDNPTLALQLFDYVVALYPDWSEAWSERATARFQAGDIQGAVGDLAQTLKREPRDIGALAGLGAIMLDSGKADEALRAYDRALALAPAYEPLKEARARAQTMVWSQSP